MSSTSASVSVQLSAQEEFTLAEQPYATQANDRTLRTGGLNLSTTLNGTSVPKVDKPPIYQKVTIPGGGSLTVDLTAAPGLSSPVAASRAVDLTGGKLKHYQLRAAGTNNASGVTVAPGGSDPYPLFGTAKSIIMGPGRLEAGGFNGVESDLPAVSATVKNITFTGASGDVVEILMLFGT